MMKSIRPCSSIRVYDNLLQIYDLLFESVRSSEFFGGYIYPYIRENYERKLFQQDDRIVS